jgi:uncharacterized damage-inducible protein DinB
MTPEAEFLRYSCEKMKQFCDRVESCVALLTPEQLWLRGNQSQNAIANLLLHLNGNIGQWILAGIANVPITRDRDAEFSARSGDLPDLRATVTAAVKVIATLPPERLTERVTIQKFDVTVLEAIYHVVEHFSGHTGQIILLTKAYTDRDLAFYSYLNQPGSAQGQTP